jgi:hypothetical protein
MTINQHDNTRRQQQNKTKYNITTILLLKHIDILKPSQLETIVAHYHTIVISCGALFVNQYCDSCTQRENTQEKVELQMAESSKIFTTTKRLFCTLHYQLYLHGQDNNAVESLASIRNNSGNNELGDVSAVGNVGGDHAINNNNRNVAFVNNFW